MSEKTKILVVDDETFNCDILTDMLEDAGYQVVAAEDGMIALTQLEMHPDISTIVLDRMMPNMNGIQVLSYLKLSDQWAHIPVIMQTAAASTEQIQEGMQAGAYYYLAKPYDQPVLLAVVKAALRDNAMRMTLQEELHKHKRMLGLMEYGRFSFRTLAEADSLSYYIANCFPIPDRAVTGLNEMMINAVEHGNLGIMYAEKTALVLEGGWLQEVERRLTLSEYTHKRAIVECEVNAEEISVTISDQGAGFDWQNYIDFSAERAMDVHGRGIAMARVKSFSHIEYIGNGNTVICKVMKKK